MLSAPVSPATSLHSSLLHTCLLHTCLLHTCLLRTYLLHTCLSHTCLLHACLLHTCLLHTIASRASNQLLVPCSLINSSFIKKALHVVTPTHECAR